MSDDECIEKLGMKFFMRFLRAVRISRAPIHCPACAHVFSMKDHLSRAQARAQASPAQAKDQRAHEEALIKLVRKA